MSGIRAWPHRSGAPVQAQPARVVELAGALHGRPLGPFFDGQCGHQNVAIAIIAAAAVHLLFPLVPGG